VRTIVIISAYLECNAVLEHFFQECLLGRPNYVIGCQVKTTWSNDKQLIRSCQHFDHSIPVLLLAKNTRKKMGLV